MCLIISNQSGKPVDRNDLVYGHFSNPDGWGAMFVENNKVHVEKGFELSDLLKVSSELGGMDAVYHMRFATHGNKDLENCHPFQVTDDIWVMHNGVLSTAELDKTKSDTWHFVNYVLSPLLRDKPELYGTPQFAALIGELVGKGNKLVFMRSDGLIQIINEKEGVEISDVWYSNYTGFGRCSYSGKYGRGSWEWNDDIEGYDFKEDHLMISNTSSASTSISNYEENRDDRFDYTYDLPEFADMTLAELTEFCREQPEDIAQSILEFFGANEEEGDDFKNFPRD